MSCVGRSGARALEGGTIRPLLVTFADGHRRYRQASQRLRLQAHLSGQFRGSSHWNVARLIRESPECAGLDVNFISAKARGMGYWLWKPLILKHILNSVPKGTLVAYLDVGCELNLGGSQARKRWEDYLAFSSDTGLLAMRSKYPTILWAKDDLLRKYGLTGSSLGQHEANFLLVSASSEGRDLVDEWAAACRANNYHFLDDSASIRPESPLFIENRHDQAVLSAILTSRRAPDLENETYFGFPVEEVMSRWVQMRSGLPNSELAGARRVSLFRQMVSDAQRREPTKSTWRSEAHQFPVWTTRTFGLLPALTGPRPYRSVRSGLRTWRMPRTAGATET